VPELPLVSCLCLTYNRPPSYLHLVAEAVESFLRQDYPGPKELVILNDAAGQTLTCMAPEVDVLNLPRRFRTIGEKYAACTALARGDVLCWWDDDDISLPWRLSRSVQALTDRGAGYYNPGGYWYLDGAGLHHEHGVGPCYNCSAVKREAYERAAVLGFGIDLDARLHDALVATSGIRRAGPEAGPEGWSYIYRWGVSPEHSSAKGMGGTDGQPASPGYVLSGQRPVAAGTFDVVPAWRQNYAALVASHLTALQGTKLQT
jgi:hypothetical protein